MHTHTHIYIYIYTHTHIDTWSGVARILTRPFTCGVVSEGQASFFFTTIHQHMYVHTYVHICINICIGLEFLYLSVDMLFVYFVIHGQVAAELWYF